MSFNDQFLLWAYQGVILGLLAIIWRATQWLAKKILDELKEMNSSLKILSDNSLIHDGEIKLAKEQSQNHDKRLNDHTNRLRNVERKQDMCTNCKL